MMWVYRFFIQLYLGLVFLLSPFYSRARKWIRGRRGQWHVMQQAAETMNHEAPLVWFHCASMGEFEQGRPVIEAFRKAYPHYRILLTFYSPSGYDHLKTYKGADHVCYLPGDTARNAARFLGIWKPRLAVFIKYEYWYNFLNALYIRHIPVVMVSAVFRPKQIFFHPLGLWFRNRLRQIDHFFVQDSDSADLLKSIGITHFSISGDTRFDRVAEVAKRDFHDFLIESFAARGPLLVAGSTWAADEDVLLALISEPEVSLRYMVVPHELNEARIEKLLRKSGGLACRYTHLKDHLPADCRMLIVDTMGMLSALYRFGQYAWVGGGFGAGIHNTLEAAAYGVPVFFGPNFERFREARELISRGGAFSVKDAEQFRKLILPMLANASLRENASEASAGYVKSRAGATGQVMQYLADKF